MWAAGYSEGVADRDGLELVTSLLKRGAAIDRADNRGRTALMIAAGEGHALVAAALLKAGADPARKDKDGKTAIDLAADEATRRVFAGR